LAHKAYGWVSDTEKRIKKYDVKETHKTIQHCVVQEESAAWIEGETSERYEIQKMLLYWYILLNVEKCTLY
jgi:flavin reductase (DIM6/NTAB) family NADH-FMN oxidoreductase RutF